MIFPLSCMEMRCNSKQAAKQEPACEPTGLGDRGDEDVDAKISAGDSQ
jgi:hypothetical protein